MTQGLIAIESNVAQCGREGGSDVARCGREGGSEVSPPLPCAWVVLVCGVWGIAGVEGAGLSPTHWSHQQQARLEWLRLEAPGEVADCWIQLGAGCPQRGGEWWQGAGSV